MWAASRVTSRAWRSCRKQAAVEDFCLFSRGGGCFTDMSPKTKKGLQVFMILPFLCSGSVCKSFLWIQVVTIAVETLCFCDISRFVFTVTMENEGGLLSPPCRWKYLVYLGKLMTARKWAHDTVLDEYSFFGRVLGLQGWALPVLSSWGQCSLGMLSPILNFQAFSWGISTPIPILWFICSMSHQADYLSHCRCLYLAYQNLYLNILL